MAFDLDIHIVGRLLLAAVLGGLVGLERELHRKPAGLRTNMLMCMGSALFTVLSQEFASRYGGDHARIAAQILPGIGFIGAGAILRERGSVAGLTTAATIFVVASVGMAAGAGLYFTAVFAALLILGANTVLGWAEGHFGLKTRLTTFRVTTASPEPLIHRVHQMLDQMKIVMLHFQVRPIGAESVVEFDADVSYAQQQQLCQKMSSPDVRCEVVPQELVRE